MKKLAGILLFAIVMASCVARQKYDDLQAKKVRLETQIQECESAKLETQEQLEEMQKKYKKLDVEHKSLTDEFEQVSRVLKRIKEEYNNLEDLHDRLTAKYDDLLRLGAMRTNQLTTDLSGKESELAAAQAKLDRQKAENDRIAADLQAREGRVKELEGILAQQKQAVDDLKSKVSGALLGFSESDLNVEVKEGKVYVSLASQLLFKSGSIKVDSKGEEALRKLAGALSLHKELSITVEGHTDDQKMSKKSSYMKDNWDLSVLRATEIVRILVENGVDPKQVQAAGRAEYKPKEEKNTMAARKKNRRTEIILSPQLDELLKLIGGEAPSE